MSRISGTCAILFLGYLMFLRIQLTHGHFITVVCVVSLERMGDVSINLADYMHRACHYGSY